MNDGDRLLENPSMSKDAMLFNSYEDLKDAKLRLDGNATSFFYKHFFELHAMR